MHAGNLFNDADPPNRGERFETLLSHRQLVIERILSSADLSPTEYRQSQDEWVVLLRGRATMSIDGNERELSAGDYLFLPAGVPHSVLSVSDGALWLAVHLHPDEQRAG